MKILYSLLLGALITSTNSSFLLAQSDNRLELPLQRQEMEDRRWKIEDEAQGCSFQNIEGRVMNENEYKDVDNQSSFLANDSVPIFHLPSSSSYLGVAPKLMMNPEKIIEVEDAFGFTRVNLLPSRSRAISTTEEARLAEGESSISAAIGGQQDIGETSFKEDINENNVEENISTLEQNIARLTHQIEEAKQKYKEKNSLYFRFWNHIASKLEQSRNSWNKVNEFIAQGRDEEASLWRTAAEESEAAAEKLKRTLQFYTSDQNEAAKQLEGEAWKDYYLSDAFTLSLKSEEALEKVSHIQWNEEDFWKDIASQYQIAADYKKQAAEVSIEERKDKRNSYSLAGDYMYLIANRKLKAFEARKIGKKTLATGYENIVGILQKALDYLKQSHVAYSEGKDMEGYGWYNAGKSLQPQADYLSKAYEAADEEKSILAAGYREAAATSEMAASREKTAAEIHTVGQNYENQAKKAPELRAWEEDDNDYTSKYLQKYEEGFRWWRVANSLQDKADYQAKACEAEEVGKAMLASCYKEAIVIAQHSADQHEISAKTVAVYKGDEQLSWQCAGERRRCQAEYQVKAYELEEVNKLSLASDYRELAAISKRAAELYELSAKAYIEKNKKGWHVGGTYERENEGQSWYLAGRSLSDKMYDKEKAIRAQEAGKTILAAGYREAAVIAEDAADHFKKAAEAKIIGKKNENVGWFRVGETVQLQSDYYIKLIEAQQSEQEITASIYREAIGVLKTTIDYYKQAVSSFVLGKEDEGIGWSNIGIFLNLKTIKKIEAFEKKEPEKDKIKKGDDKEITLEEIQFTECIPPESFIKRQKVDHSAKSKALFIYCEKWLTETKPSIGLEPILSNYMIEILKRAADHKLIKIFEEYWNHVAKAHEQGDDILALGWIQVAEDIQQAIEDSINQSKISREENRELFDAWGDAIQAGQKLAECRGKYIQEESHSQIPEILSVQKKILEKLQIVAEYRRKAAEEYSLNKELECSNFKKAAESMEEGIKQLGNVIKVFKKLADVATERQLEVSNYWRKTLDQYKESAEYHCQAAQAIASGNINAHDCLKKAGSSAEYSAKSLEQACDAREKSIKAQKSNLDEVALLWFKTAKKYEESAEYYSQSAKSEDIINNHDLLRRAGNSTEYSAKRLQEACVAVEEAIKAKEASREELAALWFETAQKYEEAVECYSQLATAIISGNSADYKRLESAGHVSERSAYELEKVARSKEKQFK